MSKTAVVLLGTGTPNAEPDRMGSALAVVVGDNVYLVDFGPGVVRRGGLAAGRNRFGRKSQGRDHHSVRSAGHFMGGPTSEVGRPAPQDGFHHAPPEARGFDWRARWHDACKALGDFGAALPEYDRHGLMFRLSPSGQVLDINHLPVWRPRRSAARSVAVATVRVKIKLRQR